MKMEIPNYQNELEKAVGQCKSLLDVGCGSNSPIKPFFHNLIVPTTSF